MSGVWGREDVMLEEQRRNEGEAKGRTGEGGGGVTKGEEKGEEKHGRDGRDVSGYRRLL